MNHHINFTIDNKQPTIDGYENIGIDNIGNIINGSVSDILCECLDLVAAKNRLDVLKAVLSKLAFEGSATFKFVNATVLGARVAKNDLDWHKLSDIVSKCQSWWTEYVITDIFYSIPNMTIEKYYIDNVYSIITLRKKL